MVCGVASHVDGLLDSLFGRRFAREGIDFDASGCQKGLFRVEYPLNINPFTALEDVATWQEFARCAISARRSETG